jgi:DNA-binding NarL/FixJ family response regulator
MSVKKYYYLNNSLSLDDCDPFIYNYFDEYYYFNDEIIFVNIKNLLSFKCSIVFELKINGFKLKEIAKLLDIPLSTVSGRISKINKTLRSLY